MYTFSWLKKIFLAPSTFNGLWTLIGELIRSHRARQQLRIYFIHNVKTQKRTHSEKLTPFISALLLYNKCYHTRRRKKSIPRKENPPKCWQNSAISRSDTTKKLASVSRRVELRKLVRWAFTYWELKISTFAKITKTQKSLNIKF